MHRKGIISVAAREHEPAPPSAVHLDLTDAVQAGLD